MVVATIYPENTRASIVIDTIVNPFPMEVNENMEL